MVRVSSLGYWLDIVWNAIHSRKYLAWSLNTAHNANGVLGSSWSVEQSGRLSNTPIASYITCLDLDDGIKMIQFHYQRILWCCPQ